MKNKKSIITLAAKVFAGIAFTAVFVLNVMVFTQKDGSSSLAFATTKALADSENPDEPGATGVSVSCQIVTYLGQYCFEGECFYTYGDEPYCPEICYDVFLIQDGSATDCTFAYNSSCTPSQCN